MSAAKFSKIQQYFNKASAAKPDTGNGRNFEFDYLTSEWGAIHLRQRVAEQFDAHLPPLWARPPSDVNFYVT